MIKNLIWDFDGTLFNTYPAMIYAFRKALQDRNIEERDKHILDYMKVSFSTAIKHFTDLYVLDNKFVEDYMYYEKNSDLNKIVPFPYAKKICEGFKNNGGKNFIFTHREEKSTIKILRFYNMEEFFTEVVTVDKGFKRKPDVEGFLYLIDKYSMNKAETLVVGDREIELIGAKNSGIRSCLYNTNEAAYSVAPDYKIDSLKNLEEILDIK
jgi:HAD superfamily hydrolase (TIGR01549 family)